MEAGLHKAKPRKVGGSAPIALRSRVAWDLGRPVLACVIDRGRAPLSPQPGRRNRQGRSLALASTPPQSARAAPLGLPRAETKERRQP